MLGECASRQHVTEAEFLSKYSFNSSSNKGDLFSNMFPDSDIAREFTCGKTKCSYIVKFGITPYFLDCSSVFKILLILSHGQAQVERGFSVIKFDCTTFNKRSHDIS